MGEKDKGEERILLRDLLKQHMEESSKFREETKVALAEIKTHATYSKSAVDDHEKRMKKLENASTFVRGAAWVLGALGLSNIALKIFVK